MSQIADAYAPAMSAYCSRCVGLGSGLAPTSQITTGPWKVERMTAMPGRLTPGSSRILSCAEATHAPVLPAEIATSAWPFFTRSDMTLIELRGLERTASTGD